MDLLLFDTTTGQLIQKLEAEATVELPASGAVSIVADVPEGVPVSFFCNGAFLRTERSRPHAIAGDLPGGKLAPFRQLSPGEHQLCVVAGADHQLLNAHLVCKPFIPPIFVSPTVGSFKPTDAFVICVSPEGNDAAEGSPTQPMRSIHAAINRLSRDPADARRKVLALRRGGVWTERITAVPNGTLIAGWGETGDRPLLRAPNGSAINLTDARDVTLADLDITTATPGTGDGGVLLRGGREIRLLGCRVSGFKANVVLKGSNTGRGQNIILDACVIRDAFNIKNADSSGLYAEQIDGLQLLNNLFLRNGWRDGMAVGSTRNQGAYIQGECGPVVASGNIFAMSCSHGLQARTGGIVTDNLFWCNGTACSFGLVEGEGPIVAGGVTGVFARNAVVGGRDIGSLQRGAGLQIGNALDVSVEANLFADQLRLNSYAAIRLEAGDGEHADKAVGLRRVIVSGNQCCRWSPGLEIEKGFSKQAKREKWQIGAVEVDTAGLGTLVNAAEIAKRVRSTAALATGGTAPLFPTHAMSVYGLGLGLPQQADAWLTTAENMDRFNWRADCTGMAITRWLLDRAGLKSKDEAPL